MLSPLLWAGWGGVVKNRGPTRGCEPPRGRDWLGDATSNPVHGETQYQQRESQGSLTRSSGGPEAGARLKILGWRSSAGQRHPADCPTDGRPYRKSSDCPTTTPSGWSDCLSGPGRWFSSASERRNWHGPARRCGLGRQRRYVRFTSHLPDPPPARSTSHTSGVPCRILAVSSCPSQWPPLSALATNEAEVAATAVTSAPATPTPRSPLRS